MEKNKINIYKYTNYREFIKDWTKEEKKVNPKFSYRYFNKLVGINSSSFLPLLINGSRNIGNEGIDAIIKGFALSERQAEYFKLLVDFEQLETPEEKDIAFRKLATYQNKTKQMLTAQYNVFSHWHYVAILELLKLDNKEVKDIDYILRRINPPVGKVVVKKAITDLLKLELIKEDKKGNLIPAHKMLGTPDEFKSVAVCQLHSEMSTLASMAVVREPAPEREFSALCIAVNHKNYLLAKKRIQEFRKELHAILEQGNDQEKNTVCQINLQLFKLSRNEE
jgi:uncharacterized protein (TIGR02147 family)